MLQIRVFSLVQGLEENITFVERFSGSYIHVEMTKTYGKSEEGI